MSWVREFGESWESPARGSESIGESPAREFRESRGKPGSGVQRVSGESPAREFRVSGKARLGSLESVGESPVREFV